MNKSIFIPTCWDCWDMGDVLRIWLLHSCPPQPWCLWDLCSWLYLSYNREGASKKTELIVKPTKIELDVAWLINFNILIKLSATFSCVCQDIKTRNAWLLLASPLDRLHVVQEGAKAASAFKDHCSKAPVIHTYSVRFTFKQLWSLRHINKEKGLNVQIRNLVA